MVLRTGPRPATTIFVSGTIGDAALGLRLRLRSARHGPENFDACSSAHYLLERYLRPQPRLALAACAAAHARPRWTCPTVLSAISPRCAGLAASRRAVDLDRVPLSDAARAAVRPIRSCCEPAGDGRRRLRNSLHGAAHGVSAASEKQAARVGVPIGVDSIGQVGPARRICWPSGWVYRKTLLAIVRFDAAHF